MTSNSISTLFVIRSGRIQESLRVLLAHVPGLHIVGQLQDVDTALALVTVREVCLVLLDYSLSGADTPAVLRRLKAEWPATRCLVLADTTEQGALARTAGADAVLLRGFPADELWAAVERILPETASSRVIEDNKGGHPQV